MKHWNLILGLVLCLIAIGGLTVLFRVDTSDKPTNDGQSSIEQPSDESTGFDDDSTESIDVESIELDENGLMF